MKVIRFILALYVFFLALSPCNDRDTCVDEQKTGIAVIAGDDLNHTSDEQESCTPFCICSGCAAHIQLAEVADIAFTHLIHNTQMTTLYQEKPVLDSSDSIWQPPRV